MRKRHQEVNRIQNVFRYSVSGIDIISRDEIPNVVDVN